MNSEALKKLITDLSADFKPSVEKIEGKIATTRNRYGDYMNLISSTAKNKQHAQIFSLAIIQAGGNKQGVADAMKCLGYA
jgi:hypothetical protein